MNDKKPKRKRLTKDSPEIIGTPAPIKKPIYTTQKPHEEQKDVIKKNLD